MHIVIDARKIKTSSGRYVERLLYYLQKIDKKNRYTILLKPKHVDDWKPTAKNFTAVSCPYKDFTFAEQVGLLKQLHTLKPDLVHFTFAQQPVLYRGSVVTTIHDLTAARFGNPAKNKFVFRVKQEVYKLVVRIVVRKSKSVITPTEFVKEDVAKFARINSRKIVVTPEAAEPMATRSQPYEDLKDTAFIMYVGRPNPHKNLNRLIAAFAILKKTHPDLKLVLVGKTDANYKLLRRYAKRLSIEDVVFTGFVSDAELRWMYENTKAYVFPSLSEGFGLPGLEAMVHGAPIVSSNATCLPEVYGEAATYFNPEDTQEIAKVIASVIDNPVKQKELSTKGRKQAARYSWQKMAEQTFSVYDSILNR